MADLQSPIFTNEEQAREALEAVRWPNGPVCPHCGAVDRQAKVDGKKHRPGLHYCNHCKSTYTATVGTVFERSKISLSKWWMACHLMSSSKKGISAHQLHRMLGVTYKTAWFMSHRIREAMKQMNPAPFGGDGKVVEADETYVGGKDKNKAKSKRGHRKGRAGVATKEAVYSLVERGGDVRSFHVGKVTGDGLRQILTAQVKRDTSLMTDEASTSMWVGREYPKHQTVNHAADEYVRGEAYTNTVEGYFSVLKRGIVGTYHHVSPQHLSRYLAEFDFRYSNRSAVGVSDAERAERLIKGVEGKRLTYRRTNEARRVS
ncbi:MAG TPA: IS1595 family transposase [Stellaceae bacterium]|nr:IS1595 family transposase [Stellaceae bacterium]HYL48930.1 IS1595 family transposase [Stellaceae bacterium]